MPPTDTLRAPIPSTITLMTTRSSTEDLALYDLHAEVVKRCHCLLLFHPS